MTLCHQGINCWLSQISSFSNRQIRVAILFAQDYLQLYNRTSEALTPIRSVLIRWRVISPQCLCSRHEPPFHYRQRSGDSATLIWHVLFESNSWCGTQDKKASGHSRVSVTSESKCRRQFKRLWMGSTLLWSAKYSSSILIRPVCRRGLAATNVLR